MFNFGFYHLKNYDMKSRRNFFMSITLMCLFLIMTFQFDNDGFYWMWEGKMQVPVILGISAMIFGAFWIIEHRKLST